MTSARSHLAELNKAGKARTSVARKLSALRTFVRYLRREDLIEHDPDRAGGGAEARSDDPRAFLSEPEIDAAARNARHRRSAGPPRSRDSRAVLRLGAAAERAGRLDMEDLNLSGRMVRVMGKGGKERLVPFNQSAADALRAWLKDRAAILATRQPRSAAAARRAEAREGANARQRRSAVRQLPRHAADRPQRRSPAAALRRAVQHADGHQPARAAPLVCDAPAAARRRPARHPGTARPRRG